MSAIDYLIILAYLLLLVCFGFFLQQKANENLDSYFLGNRRLPWWLLGASGMVSNTDLAGTMLISSLIYSLGTKGLFIEIRGGLVLIMPFLMTFMGKWNRRAQVMTLAEWMEFRFGKGREGNIARLVSAIAMLIFSLGALSYFSLAGGKFLGEFIGLEDRYAAICLIVIALVYTTASGFYGVIWTDVFQGILVLGAIIYICYLALTQVNLPDHFNVALPGSEQLHNWSFSEWTSITPPLTLDLAGDYQIFQLFGGIVFFYLVKTIIEGCSGQGGYMIQRYFAARSDRETVLLSLFWIILLAWRWPLVTAFAVLGIAYQINTQAIVDPELILPVVINNYLPKGIKGLVIACFMAAAMSTFDSIINSSAAYWVKDIYQPYLHPQASENQLLQQSRLASVVIVSLGLLLSFNLSNINDIWGWLSVGLGIGLAIPLLLRWYWWRFNGYGFAIGTLAGAIAAIASKWLLLPQIPHLVWQEYSIFLIPALSSLIGCILGTIFTPATPTQVIVDFYRQTRPFGFWGIVQKHLPNSLMNQIKQENRRDILATVIAVPGQVILMLSGIMLISKNWYNLTILIVILSLLSLALYLVWFRYLPESK